MELREKIAVHLWAYPVKHSWLTFEDAKSFSDGSKIWVAECYQEADDILALIIRPAPSVEEIKKVFSEAKESGLLIINDDKFGTVENQLAQEIADLGREK